MRTRVIAACQVALATVGPVALGQTPTSGFRREFAVPDDHVTAVAVSEASVFVAGAFDHVGPHTGAFGVVDGATGDVADLPPLLRGEVWAIVSDGLGGWYVGGDLSMNQGTPVYLVHLLPDGAIDPLWQPEVGGVIRTMELVGSTLYIGGSFGSVNGFDHDGLAAIDTVTAEVLPWITSVDGIVGAVAVHGSEVYFGGSFDEVNGTPRAHLAAVDATTGQLLPWNPSAGGSIGSMLRDGTTLYVGGSFGSIGGEPRSGVAAFDLASGSVTDWNPGADGAVLAMVLVETLLYVGGAFEALGGEPRTDLGAVDAITGEVHAWAPVPAGNDGSNTLVNGLASFGSDVVVAGSYTSMNGEERHNLSRVSAETGDVQPWTANAAGITSTYARAVVAADGQVAVGGKFSIVGSTRRAGLAAIDLATGAVQPWAPALAEIVGAEISVEDLLVDGSTVYVAGKYDLPPGQPQPLLAAVDAITGEPLPGFEISAEPKGSILKRIDRHGDLVYGAYDGGVGFGTAGIGAASATTGGAPALLLSTSNSVLGLDVAAGGDHLCFGGEFGAPRQRLGCLTLPDLELTALDATISDDVLAVLSVGSTVYAAGEFQVVEKVTRRRLAAFDAITGALLDWNPNVEGGGTDYASSLARLGSSVLVGGRFDFVGDVFRDSVAAVDGATGRPTDWAPNATGEVRDFAVAPDVVVIGGIFANVAGRSRQFLAVFPVYEPCFADVDGNHDVGVSDLVAVILAWGTDDADADIDDDGVVGVADLVEVILAWGPCAGEPCGTGDCLVAHGGTGCGDPDCCTLVCASAPHCCEVAWDSACVAEAQAGCVE